MNFSTLVTSVVASLALTSAASAQWLGGGSGINIGVAGGYSKTTFPNGQSISNTNVNWGVGMGSSSSYGTGYPAYGGYGYGGYGYGGYGGYGYGIPPAVVMPYRGGYGVPAVVPFNPYGGCYGNYAVPQYYGPAACGPQIPVVW